MRELLRPLLLVGFRFRGALARVEVHAAVERPGTGGSPPAAGKGERVQMMTGELYFGFFMMLGVYVTVTVWQRTAEERRVRERARAERRAIERVGAAPAPRDVKR